MIKMKMIMQHRSLMCLSLETSRPVQKCDKHTAKKILKRRPADASEYDMPELCGPEVDAERRNLHDASRQNALCCVPQGEAPH